MDSKRLHKSKRHEASASMSPAQTEIISSKRISSPDLPVGSQECFKVGWDWSEKGDRKRPQIKFVEAVPCIKRRDINERLQCLRPRRLLPSPDITICDTSSFMNDLKSLAAQLNSHSSSVGTNSCNQLSNVVPSSTPKRCPTRNVETEDKSVEHSTRGTPLSHKEVLSSEPCDIKDWVNDLLEDSHCEEMLKCTQELETQISSVKTPVLPEQKISTSSTRKRLSLSLRKKKSLCRRLDNSEDSSPSSRNISQVQVKLEGKSILAGKHNSTIQKTHLGRSPLTKKASCFIEKEMKEPKKPISVQFEGNAHINTEKEGSSKIDCDKNGVEDGVSLLDSDDFFESPDVLGIIDQYEKKATQELATETTSCKATSTKSSNDISKKLVIGKNISKHSNTSKSIPVIAHGPGNFKVMPMCVSNSLSSHKEVEAQKINHESVSKDCLNSERGRPNCTPEEIERKRMEAIRKRLSLKKKRH